MITIKNLKKNYGVQRVLNVESLVVSKGSLFALLGPNGSGKTTLLKILLGLVKPSPHSEVIVGDRRQIGYMSQFPGFPPHLKVKELPPFFEKLKRRRAPFQEKLIADLRIDSFWNKYFYELSGGMAQKVNILQCFMFDHSLFILDEPTSGLDPHTAFYLKELLKEKKKEGHTLLFTSHILSEVEELSDRMALLADEKVCPITLEELRRVFHHRPV